MDKSLTRGHTITQDGRAVSGKTPASMGWVNALFEEQVAESSISGHGVTSCLPAAVAPPGYIMVEACPPLETKRQKRSLVGKLILYGWEDDDRTGWFVGRVAHNRVTARDKRGVPTANYIVRYTAKQTNGQIDGLVACELSARTYGASQWWVLLQRSGADLCRTVSNAH